jgi:alanyl-tRNA synthetase
MRIVADHSRGAAFLIADGVVPSNEDRGYILRRSCGGRSSRAALGLEAPGSAASPSATIEIMGGAYPEAGRRAEAIGRTVGDEEESFGRSVERGTELLEG